MEEIPLLFKPDSWETDQKMKIIRWNLQEGSPFDYDTLLFEYFIPRLEENYDPLTLKFYSQNDGTIKKIIAKPNTMIGYSDELAIIETCPHDIVFDNLCASCGKNLSNNRKFLQKRVSIVHSSNDIKVSKKVVNEITTNQIKRLSSNKKLALILDLDNTLIHTITLKEDELIPNTSFEIEKFRLENDANYYYVCIRPGVRGFLEKISKFYELHIYTMGIKKYAQKISSILDPSGKYFSNRILSRDDYDEQFLTQKNLHRIFPADDTYVLIVDDREDVWLQETENNGLKICDNLIQITPFHCFYETTHLNEIENLLKNLTIDKNKFEIEKKIKCYDYDQKREKNTLLLVSNILEECHKTFYSSKTKIKNVKAILSDFKRQVLKGCNIWFPLSLFETDVNTFKVLISKAFDFGATCYYEWNTKITHTIAIDRRQLDELCQALDKERPMHLVSPEWIHSSCIKWEKQKEYLFTQDFEETEEKFNLISDKLLKVDEIYEKENENEKENEIEMEKEDLKEKEKRWKK
ncbi:RNA polymerase ii subunit a c-terminal domain phosphatase [Anaeramoeba flamelloides]|uniref:RNA polymerase II subunit A C-terminal domain phosphatase n=1 Tax=Anaeramoeba flamelloides TaxID=1746091 RepID=A0ABQ8Z2H7_9EUKA|nr:RNA polymerase ii subunit a c-terminal domain phosphatase [Anaeramoeba flamelloides]